MLKRSHIAMLCFAILIMEASAFTTDDAKNRRVMANEVFYKADLTKDYKLSAADGAAWGKYGAFDIDADGQVSFDEFVAKAELPYPQWDGEIKRNVVYKRVGDETLLLDIYAPRVKKYEKAPVFFYTHGGGWSGGSKEIGGAEQPLFEALSKEGFVCVSVMYRLVKMWSPEDSVIMRDCLVDCRDGLRFLKKHEHELGIDTDRIVVFGSSAGGHIAQLLTFSGADDFTGDSGLSNLQVEPVAGISWFGPSDFRDTQLFETENLEDKFAPDHWAKRIMKTDTFSYKEADAETKRLIEEMSPVCYLKKESAPLLHIHGDQDVVISPNHAHHLKQHAEAVDAPVDVAMVKGAGHGWWAADIDPDRKTVDQMTVAFALKHAGEGR
jgi:acetyl esterase/lipase